MMQEWFLYYSSSIGNGCLIEDGSPFLIRQEMTSTVAASLVNTERLDKIFLNKLKAEAKATEDEIVKLKPKMPSNIYNYVINQYNQGFPHMHAIYLEPDKSEDLLKILLGV